MQNLMPTNAIENTVRAKFFGELVLTTAQLAEFYGTSTDNIKKNFNANKERFVDGKHYYRLEGENLRRFQNNIAESSKRQNTDLNLVTESYPVRKHTPFLYVWTERGAARHAKMLNTDKAWEVFELLEDTYFNVRAEKEKAREKKPAEAPPPIDESAIPLIDYRKAFEIAGLTQFCVDPQRFEHFRREISKYLAQCNPPKPQFQSPTDEINLFYFK